MIWGRFEREWPTVSFVEGHVKWVWFFSQRLLNPNWPPNCFQDVDSCTWIYEWSWQAEKWNKARTWTTNWSSWRYWNTEGRVWQKWVVMCNISMPQITRQSPFQVNSPCSLFNHLFLRPGPMTLVRHDHWFDFSDGLLCRDKVLDDQPWF